jgi:hypothetical protein
MKVLSLLFCLSLLSGISGCMASAQSTERPVLKKPANADSMATIQTVYVIAREGTAIWEKPDSTSEPIDWSKFGKKLEVVKDLGKLLAIKRPHYVSSPAVYVLKAATGTELEIPLTKEDLHEVYTEYSNQEEGPEPYKNIVITLIPKAKFYEMKKTAVNHFTPDTSLGRKKNGEFSLKIGGKLKKFKDEPGKNENAYQGQFKGLNKYLVAFVWYEAEDIFFELIDKTTGKQTASFESFPFYSKDRKFIMCLEANLYRDFAEMYVYEATADTVKLYAQGEFKNWMPAESQDKFWGSDNCFYAAVLPSVAYWQPGDPARKNLPPDYNFRYIKIKIKGPTVIPPVIIPYYPDNKFGKYDKLTETLTYEQEIKRIDSLRNKIDSRLKSFTKTKHPKSTDTFCFWKGKELQAMQSFYQDDKTDNMVKWYFHEGKFLTMTQMVTYRDSGKYFTDDNYYSYNGRIFAWLKSGKWIHPNYLEFEKISSNLPEMADKLAEEAKETK